MGYMRIGSAAVVLFAVLPVSVVSAHAGTTMQGTLPWDSVLTSAPLSWEKSPERGADWQRLEAEGRIKFEADTGNYLISYTTPSGDQKTWVFEPASKLRVEVQAEVTFDPETSTYTYTYTVRNDADSAQRMRRFAVSHEGAQVWNAFALPDDPEVEGGWYFSPRALKRDIAAWGHTEGEGSGIAQGETAVFSFQSDVSPGVARAYANGYVPMPHFAEGEAPADPRPDFTGQSAQGLTVGPLAAESAGLPAGYVTLRPLLTSLGWSLAWDSTAKMVLARQADRTLSVVVASNAIVLNGTPISLKRPAQVLGSRMRVSAELINYIDPVVVSQRGIQPSDM